MISQSKSLTTCIESEGQKTLTEEPFNFIDELVSPLEKQKFFVWEKMAAFHAYRQKKTLEIHSQNTE